MAFRFPTDRILPSEERWHVVKSWLRSIFLEDWVTKTLALLITLVLWYGVTGRRAPTTVLMRGVHLSFRLPSDAEISNEPVSEVEVTVTGDKNRIDRLNPRDLAVAIDLSEYKPGDLVVQLKPETVNIELPPGVKLDQIEPNRISVRLEERIEREAEVKPTFTGQLPEGYELYNVSVIPNRVRVRGSASHVNALDRIPTEKVKLDNLTEDTVVRQVTVDLLDPKITVLDAVVDVALKIGEQRIEKSFFGVPVRDASGANATPETATVTLFGQRSALDQLTAENLQIELARADDGSPSPRLVFPSELQNRIELRSIKPNEFSVAR